MQEMNFHYKMIQIRERIIRSIQYKAHSQKRAVNKQERDEIQRYEEEISRRNRRLAVLRLHPNLGLGIRRLR